MIKLHRLNDSEIYLNSAQIEFMEETPDTVIHLLNDKKYIVKESCEDVLSKIIDYNQNILGKKLR